MSKAARYGSGSCKTLPSDVNASRDGSNVSEAARYSSDSSKILPGDMKPARDGSNVSKAARYGSGSPKTFPDNMRAARDGRNVFEAARYGSGSSKRLPDNVKTTRDSSNVSEAARYGSGSSKTLPSNVKAARDGSNGSKDARYGSDSIENAGDIRAIGIIRLGNEHFLLKVLPVRSSPTPSRPGPPAPYPTSRGSSTLTIGCFLQEEVLPPDPGPRSSTTKGAGFDRFTTPVDNYLLADPRLAEAPELSTSVLCTGQGSFGHKVNYILNPMYPQHKTLNESEIGTFKTSMVNAVNVKAIAIIPNALKARAT